MTKRITTLANPHPILGDTTMSERLGYSPAVRAGDLLFIAGQIGIRPDQSVPDDVSEQSRLAFERLGAILAAEGLGFEHLVELVSYHVDIQENFPAFVAVKNRYITRDFPTWTGLGVVGLARPGLMVEIKTIAMFPR